MEIYSQNLEMGLVLWDKESGTLFMTEGYGRIQ